MNCEKAIKEIESRLCNTIVFPEERSHYFKSYSSLIELANNLSNDAKESELLMLGCGVYSWMPTILKRWDFECFSSGGIGGIAVGKLRKLQCLSSSISTINDNVGSPILNNSWVGTSKFLHFINPAVFPIWDSRVAKRFGLTNSYQIGKKDSYLCYMKFCKEVLTGREGKLDFSALDCVPEFKRLTDIRKLELLLFL